MDGADLQSCTRRELLALAGKAQVRGRHRMSKDQLLAAIGSLATAPSPEAGRAAQPGRRKSPPRAEREPSLTNLTELPSSYGRTRLTLMAIDPYRIHAYWEVTPRDHEAVLARLGPERTAAHWVLRFHDVTYMDFDGTNAQSHFDVPIDLSAGNWYVSLWSSEKSYCADIGALAASGRFEIACRSNFVQTPRAEPSPHYRPEWLHVEELGMPSGPLPMTATVAAPQSGDTALPVIEADVREYYDELVATSGSSDGRQTAPAEPPASVPPAPFVAEPPVDGIHDAPTAAPSGRETHRAQPAAADAPEAVPRHGSPAYQAHREARLPETVSSFGSGGWAPTGQPAVDLKLNAELVISGRAQPGQTLQVNGQWLTVNADGTFSLRLALPIRE
jgi:hypothetical protein